MSPEVSSRYKSCEAHGPLCERDYLMLDCWTAGLVEISWKGVVLPNSRQRHILRNTEYILYTLHVYREYVRPRRPIY